MSSTELLRRLHEHRRWASYKLLEAAENLGDEQLYQVFEIGQGSI